MQHGRAASVRSTSTVDSETTSVSSQSSIASNDTVRGEDIAEANAMNELPQAPASQEPVLGAKTSAFSTISGFLNRGLRINHLETPPNIVPSSAATGPHIKLTFRHEHKKMSCIVYYAQEFAGKGRHIAQECTVANSFSSATQSMRPSRIIVSASDILLSVLIN